VRDAVRREHRGHPSGQRLGDYGAEWLALSASGDKIDNG